MQAADGIRLLLEAKAAALVARNARDLDALLHGDFVYINAGGRVYDKAGYIEAYCTSGKVVFAQQRFADLAVRLIDGFAVATLSVSDEFRVGERMVSGRYQSLCVFSQALGRWVAGQTMAVGAA